MSIESETTTLEANELTIRAIGYRVDELTEIADELKEHLGTTDYRKIKSTGFVFHIEPLEFTIEGVQESRDRALQELNNFYEATRSWILDVTMQAATDVTLKDAEAALVDEKVLNFCLTGR